MCYSNDVSFVCKLWGVWGGSSKQYVPVLLRYIFGVMHTRKSSRESHALKLGVERLARTAKLKPKFWVVTPSPGHYQGAKWHKAKLWRRVRMSTINLSSISCFARNMGFNVAHVNLAVDWLIVLAGNKRDCGSVIVLWWFGPPYCEVSFYEDEFNGFSDNLA